MAGEGWRGLSAMVSVRECVRGELSVGQDRMRANTQSARINKQKKPQTHAHKTTTKKKEKKKEDKLLAGTSHLNTFL